MDEERSRIDTNLQAQTENLENIVRTMPPDRFLLQFAEKYQVCQSAVSELHQQQDPPSRDSLIELARGTVAAFAFLAAAFDDVDPDEVRYAANIMLPVQPDELTPDDRAAMEARLIFVDPETSISKFNCVLHLRVDLSGATDAEGVDSRLTEIVLPVPALARTAAGKRRILPGAAVAYSERRFDWVLDTGRIVEQIETEGDFTQATKVQIQEYFLSTAGQSIRSFLSQPLFVDEVAVESGVPPIAILNIHRNEPDMLKGRGEAVRHFVMALAPLRMLLVRLLIQLRHLESKLAGDRGIDSVASDSEERLDQEPEPE